MLKIGRICNLWNKGAECIFQSENVIFCTAFFVGDIKKFKTVDQCIAHTVYSTQGMVDMVEVGCYVKFLGQMSEHFSLHRK